jgi:hypothetical protein
MTYFKNEAEKIAHSQQVSEILNLYLEEGQTPEAALTAKKTLEEIDADVPVYILQKLEGLPSGRMYAKQEGGNHGN